MLHSNRTYIIYKELILNKSEREGMVAFTITKCHINTIAIIKLFPIKHFMQVKGDLLDLWSIQGVVPRNQPQKLGIFR